MWRWILAAAVASCGCAEHVNQEGAEIQDPIQGVGASQQLTIMRRTIDQQWPLTVGKGTLGCRAGAVMFRAGGTTYAVNDAARAQGFASIDPIRAPEPSPPPSNPLNGRTQDERMQVFRELSRCSSGTLPVQSDCTHAVGAKYRLTDADIRQIRAEGVERSWPPLQRRPADLQPLVDRGLKLCKG